MKTNQNKKNAATFRNAIAVALLFTFNLFSCVFEEKTLVPDTPVVNADLQLPISDVKAEVSASESSDAELMDIRIGIDGKTYASAGSAVRSQISNFKNDFKEITVNLPNLFDNIFDESGYIDKGTDVDSLLHKRTSKYYHFDVANGEVLRIHLSDITTNFNVQIYDENKTFIAEQTCNNLTDVRRTITESGYFRVWTNATFSGKAYVGQLEFSDYESYDNYKVPYGAFAPDAKSMADKANLIYQQLGKNIFNPDADGIIEGAYLDTSGNVIVLSGWNISDFIAVTDYESIVASVWSADNSYLTYGKLSFMHAYNANKEHIAKVWDTSANGAYTIGTNVAFIRFCWQPAIELANGKKLMIESGTAHSSVYEPYKLTSFFMNSAYPDKEEVKTMIENGGATPINDIVCWGDSLTYSQYSENVTYPSRLAVLVGKTVLNFGMPGASSMDISGLQGGMPMYVAPFTLPADSSEWAEVTFCDVNGNSDMYFGFMHYSFIDAINCVMHVGGIQVDFSYAGNNVYRLKRHETAATATVFDRPVKFNCLTNYSDYINIFWVGTNDAPTTPEKAQRTIDIIKNMVEHYGGKRYLVLGLTVKSYADAINDLMGQAFGNHYVDVKDYLIRYGLDDNNLTPTAQDTTDISNSRASLLIAAYFRNQP